MFKTRKLLGFLFVISLLTPAAFGQDVTGTINGRLNDSTGAVIPGVTITLTSPMVQGSRQAVSGETGAYQFLLLPSGTYTLKFELPGFKTINHEGIIVQVQKTATINEVMEVAAAAETITVTGETPVVDVQNATVGVNFNQSMLRDIPNSRDIWIVLAQTPGVNTTRYDVGGSTMGSQSGFRAYGTSGQNSFNLDGITTTDGSGSAGWYYDFGTFSEIQVSAAANSAEIQTPGAFTNMVIKSGGNELHGRAYIDWENKHFQGSNVTDDMSRVCPTAANAATFTGSCGLYTLDAQGNRIPGGDKFSRYNDFNVDMGGYVKKDKLWWYASWRDQYSDLITQLGLRDTATNQYGLPLNATSVEPGGHYTTRLRIPTVKFNWQVTQNNSFVFLWQHSRKKAPYRSGQGANAYRYIVESTGNQKDPSDGRKIQWTSILSPKLTMDLKIADSEYIFPMYSHVEKTPISETGNNATQFVRGGLPGPFVEWRKHWDFGGTMAYFREGLAGNHNLKFGYDTYWESTRDFMLTYPGGGYSLTLNNGAPNQVLVRDYPYTSKNAVYQNAAFIQDKWEIRRRLTLNIGLRWDRYAPYYAEQFNKHEGPFGDPATWLPSGVTIPQTNIPKTHVVFFNNFAPRFNFVYDIFGNGKTAIKGSVGRFTWNPSFNLASSANPNRGGTYTFTWDGTLPITKAYLLSRPRPNTNVPSSTTIASDLSNSWTDEYTAGIDQELSGLGEIFRDIGVRLNFVRKIEQNPYGSVNTSQDASAFTPLTRVDPGPDGLTGTADDQNIVLYNLRPELVGVNTTLIKNFPGIGSNFSTIEASVTKRFSNKWMALVGFDRTKRNPRQDLSLDPNTLVWGGNADVHYWEWSFKSVFQYTFPYGINFTTIYNAQKGETYARTLSITGFNQGTFTATVEHSGQNFYPAVKLWNARIEKQFKVTERQSIAAMFDLFNIPNQNTATGWVTSTGVTYQRQITTLLNPRIFRLGARYTF